MKKHRDKLKYIILIAFVFNTILLLRFCQEGGIVEAKVWTCLMAEEFLGIGVAKHFKL